MRFLFLALTIHWAGAQTNDTIIFPSKEGFILGRRVSTTSHVFGVFLGIPYAEPPLNKLRFKDPIPKAPWSPGVWDASGTWKPKCPQRNPLEIYNPLPQSEDCLYLNIMTPRIDANDSGQFPVLVSIHGGGLAFGSASFGRPLQGTLKRLVSKGVVLVSFNYRLGALGFWTSSSNAAPGNYGFMDQVLVLKWIQRNIRSFGGDPTRVTLIGMSSGADSVDFLSLSPLTKGLFHQGIMMSGSAFSSIATMYPPPDDLSTRLARNLSCLRPSAEATLSCLRGQPVSALLDAFENINQQDPENDVWGATIGAGAFLPESLANLARQRAGKNLKMIIGTTKSESLGEALTTITPGQLREVIAKAITRKLHFKNILAVRAAVEYEYIDKPLVEVNQTSPMLWILLKSSLRSSLDYFLGTYKNALYLTQAAIPTYLYSFDFIDPAVTNATHGSDLPFSFGWIPLQKPSQAAFRLQDQIGTFWTNFAKYGNPTPTQVDGVFWPQTQFPDPVYLSFDSPLSVRSGYRKREMAFWFGFITQKLDQYICSA